MKANMSEDGDGVLVLMPETEQEALDLVKWFEVFQDEEQNCQAMLTIPRELATAEILGEPLQ